MKTQQKWKNQNITEQHVLIVDDDKDFAESLNDLLLMKGYKVTVVYGYNEALNAVKDFKAEVALIDIRLGTANGIDLMGSLRKAIPEILCVILTAYAGIENAIKALQNGAYDYLRKPINAEDLFSTLNRCFEKVELERERVAIQLELQRRNLDLEKTVKERNAQIIERERAEEALRISEENYRALYEDNPAMYFSVSKEGIIQSVNRYGCVQLGYSPHELIGKPVLNVFYEDDKDAVLGQMQKCLEEPNTLHSWELRKVHKNGKVIWVRETAKTITDKDGIPLVLIVCEDITDRKQSEVALIESEKKYRLIADNTADTIAVFDMNLNYTYISPSVIKLLGYTPVELMGLGLEKIVSSNSWQIIQQTFMEEMELEKSGKADPNRSRVFITEQYCKDGTKIWVEGTTSFIRDKFGKPINILAISRDVTERMQAEKVKSAIYRISESAHTASSQDVLFSTIHAIISELMPAQNFYIAHYNSATDTVHFPYYSDEFDASPPPRKLGLGLTDYVLRNGKPLLASPQVFEQLVQSGQVESIGAASVDWLGVPLKSQQNETIGVMAVQTYAGEIRLNATDQKMLEFVSAQVSMAIERKRAEEALLESEERFRNLYENAPIGLYRTTPGGKILLANRALIKMLGYSSFNELALRNLEHDGFEPSYERKEFISKIESQGEVHNLEARWVRHDGNVIVAKESAKAIRDSNGKTLYFDGTVEDVTERKIAEEKVMQLSRAVEQSPASILITDLEGNIEYCNKKVSEVTGYSLEELLGKNPSILSSGETSKEEYKILWQTISSGNEWNGTFHNKRKNGELYWEYAQISPIKDESGKFSHYLAIQEDITERVKAEQELETYRNHLEELVKARTHELGDANKSLQIEIEKEKQFEMLLQQSLEKEKELSEMKSRFISTISHEFRTPLTSVLSSADLIQEYNEKLNSAEKLELLGRIKKSVRYLTKLLDDVLTISRTETGKISFNPEQLDIQKFAKECMVEIRSLLSDKHELIFNYGSVQKKFFLDAKLLRFILSNMLSNAIKYSPEGGKIELKISSNKEHLIIEVRDEGIGVPVSEINKIFDSFYRTKNVGTIPGTGLGLTIVKRAVEMHNGEILVFSEINKGTTFSIKIPLSMER